MRFSSWVHLCEPVPVSIAESVHGGKYYFKGLPSLFVLKLILALDIPVDIPGHDGLFFAYHFEAVYLLPRANDTELTYPPIINKRSLSRQLLYKNVEKHLERYNRRHPNGLLINVLFSRQGYDGKNCLIRSICEAAEYSTEGTGVLGDILHVILS